MFQRALRQKLLSRLQEPRRFLQILLGPRQVGKTTLVHQLADEPGIELVYASADEATARDAVWIETHWQRARLAAQGGGTIVLALDEIQKVPDWSSAVKAAWDEDTRRKVPLRVLLLGSSPLFAGRGVTESLAGRFEVTYASHWSASEMASAFGYSFEEYLYFGGYPGAASLRDDVPRWRQYMREAIIEAVVARDILVATRVEKPALLRNLFFLACEYSGQILSFTKMLGQLSDAGNTTTLAHYLDLLSQSGLVTGLQKFSTGGVRSRKSSPKLIALDPSLLTSPSDRGRDQWIVEPEARGRLVESVVAAHCWRQAQQYGDKVQYWADGRFELDLVYSRGGAVVAIEVKSGRRRHSVSGLVEYKKRHPKCAPLIVGAGGVPIEEFLATDIQGWLPGG